MFLTLIYRIKKFKRTLISLINLYGVPMISGRCFLNSLTQAAKSIRLYQQSIQDDDLAQKIANAAKRGVKVDVLMMPFPFSKTKDFNIPNQELIQKNGGFVFLHKKHYIHAKVMIIDNQLMYVGSCNFYDKSLDNTRELGVLTSDPVQIDFVNKIFDKDLKNCE